MVLTTALKALTAFNTNHVDRVRSNMDAYRACHTYRRANLISIEHWLASTRADLSISPLRGPGLRPEVSRILCEICVGELIESGDTFRHLVWDELPGSFSLPTWRVLSEFGMLE
jgi:hypothetical protein